MVVARGGGSVGVAVAIGVALAGCSGGARTAGPVEEEATDARGLGEVVGTDAVADGSGAEDAQAVEVAPDDRLPAETYCERTVDMFCAYYLRCGRMAVDTPEACRTTFLEACNARYEPVYAALAGRGDLALSAAGLAACADHLGRVACAAQVNDLDGCPGVWLGRVPEGGACGLGIESFVCDDTSVCVLGLDFCGRCRPLAVEGAPCDVERRCAETAECVDGACVNRGRPGEPCGDGRPCAVGVSCQAGRCALLDVRAVGQPCGAGVRCQYRATCQAGVCARTGLLGEPCSAPTGCASGRCAGLTPGGVGTCVALLEPGAPCAASPDCRSGACRDGICAGFVSGCMP
jgi:hypothetical protein